MANQHREKLRGVRGVDDQLWTDFGDATARVDSDRSAEIRRFMEWYVRRDSAEHPRRPAPPEPPADAT
ncbi:hypothetical protein [Streptomyces rubrogriseus]|uniref:hypothetical protein n=1 Tax=Streptomyces rubrogriseus TaxID=194673 RepID=UPI000D593530|nr:hypothetical protein [Streptomyces rubrogriseus]